jgi:cytochrome c553
MRHPMMLAAAALLTAAAAAAQPSAPAPGAAATELRQCSICHGRSEFKKVQPDGAVRPLFVDESELERSVHARWQCVDCHADIERIPHPDALAPVNCQRCHFPGNPVGAPEDVSYEGYVESVHGRLRLAGNPRAPLCQDCHGSHLILRRDDQASRVNVANVPQTCGRCHIAVYAQYERSAHGRALLVKGNREAPSCASCHGEHGILPAKESASEVSATNIPETCSHCHGSLAFNTRFDIPIDPVKTFKHTFHGIANELGSQRVAQCASCHTAHDVLPPEDPRSSVNAANIPATCGAEGCHVGANANYARGRFHVDPTSRDSGIIYWVALFFKILTISTLVGLITHILLDLVKKLRMRHAGGHAGE